MQIEERIKIVEVMALEMDSPVVLDEGRPLREVIQQLSDSNSGCALLTRDDRLTGIFTERDLVVRVLGAAHSVDQTVAEYMTSNPESVSPTDPIRKKNKDIHIQEKEEQGHPHPKHSLKIFLQASRLKNSQI